MCFTSKIRVDGLRVRLDIVSKLVEPFKGGFSNDGSDVCLLEKSVLVVDSDFHSEDVNDQLYRYVVMSFIEVAR